ncbi:uncharacterized protein B0H64DRAFT_446454 [Chaetomium fimeti]|uniref:Protein kinase domain-containing protein n=1 Tax=Chaetomium fimeti TaxID=1854472 RepID=A0AAE0H766_9PEZI|nr:hypothetical protein B0H64DRAFT_446454 [Chaetomium fimeti]
MIPRELPVDDEKPPCPYAVRMRFGVTVHNPPLPFGGGSYRDNPEPRPWEQYRHIVNFTQTRYCVKDLRLDEPPVNPSSRANPPARSLVIDSLIRGGDQVGAQVVTCHWENDVHDTKYVAKIYDPLYYNFEEPDHPGMPTDVVWNAARDYSIEAAAYQQLQAYDKSWAEATPDDESRSIRGCYPAFFGSFSTTLKLVCDGKSYTRIVPLILMEHLPLSMDSQIVIKSGNNPNGWDKLRVVELPGTEHFRIHTFARAASSFMRLTMAGVGQGDFAPRNIFLVARPDSAQFRVVIADFNIAKIFPLMTPKRAPPATMDPISFCEDPSWEDRFGDWLPQWFFTDKEKRRASLKQEFPSGKP